MLQEKHERKYKLISNIIMGIIFFIKAVVEPDSEIVESINTKL